MSILAECPVCHNRKSLKNRKCSCGENLLNAKRSERVTYWISYRLPGGKQIWERVGTSIDEARAADGKRRAQKKENRIFDVKPDCKWTFEKLAEWFLKLEKVKAMAYHPTLQYFMKRFNEVFGNTLLSDVKAHHIEDYQAKRKAEGLADRTIDGHIQTARTMIRKAFDNDMVSGDVLKVFMRIPRMLKRNANARKRILSLPEFEALYKHLPNHAKWILATGFYAGMRRGEIVKLTWDKVSLKKREIQLEAKDTKSRRPRIIPICDELYTILKSIPRNLQDSHVFHYCGRPVRDIRETIRRACKDAGILYGQKVKDGFVYHDLRHSWNTYMRKAGVAESVIMEMSGHTTREMFDRYNTIDTEDREEAVSKFQQFLTLTRSEVQQGEEAQAGQDG